MVTSVCASPSNLYVLLRVTWSMVDFNLDFYTEVQDLKHLENALSTSSPPRFAALNMEIVSLIEDYSLVGFETLAVEVCSFVFTLLKRVHFLKTTPYRTNTQWFISCA
jgi:hypothetical protein